MEPKPNKAEDEKHSTPKVDALEALLKVYSVDELMMIAEQSRGMIVKGYGSVTITFQNHHPRHIECMYSIELPSWKRLSPNALNPKRIV